MKLVRKIVREGQYDKLRSLFNYYDSDSSGQVARSELWRLFQDLGLQPRSRKEQLEMKQIFDEVDENGNGQFTFDEFVVLVQRSQEHLERLVRMSEEQYGESIGLSFKRVRELRKLFQDHKTENVLSVEGLRAAMNQLQRWYSPEELFELFEGFFREDLGGVDSRGFLRLMGAIEVSKTVGQLPGQSQTLHRRSTWQP